MKLSKFLNHSCRNAYYLKKYKITVSKDRLNFLEFDMTLIYFY